MAKGYKSGVSSLPAGLKIVGNPRPSFPKEGNVWVNTDTEITGHVLSATQPENPTAGMLWIKISDSSSIKVGTPLGKDYITIMLISVSQYVGGAWQSVEAQSFQNGVWSERIVLLIRDGKYYSEDITGGFVAEGKKYSSSATNRVPTVKVMEGYVSIGYDAQANASGIVRTSNKVDLTGRRTINLFCDGYNPHPEDTGTKYIGLFVWSAFGTLYTDNAVAYSAIPNENQKNVTLDVSSLTGSYYIGFGIHTGSGVKVYDFYID